MDRAPDQVTRCGACVFRVRESGNPRGGSGHPRGLGCDRRHDRGEYRTKGTRLCLLFLNVSCRCCCCLSLLLLSSSSSSSSSH